MEQKINYKFKLLSALDKVFGDETPSSKPECLNITALKGETVSFQAAYAFDFHASRFARIRVKSLLKSNIRIRRVVSVPCSYPAHPNTDDNYLRTVPGLYPDLLSDLEDNRIMFVAGQWRSLWLDVEVTDQMPAGEYPVTLQFTDYMDPEKVLGELTQKITIYDVTLPVQTLIRTEWFHGDCLAEYYSVEVFSEEHWRILENFIEAAAKRGCNMMLTPHLTPPLDTAKGCERMTIQLVDISVENSRYEFDFNKLERWIRICRKAGITYFEMSHLFTQWGAVAAPKVMGKVDGVYTHLFGWDTPAVGGEYSLFLNAYLPCLTAFLKEEGVADATYFHISDEPNIEQLESYRAAKNSVAELLKDFTIMDALSDYAFYETGVLEKPVCSNNHIHTFLDNHVEHMWSYYCTAQNIDVSNRFFAMPSARTRIYGLQLFKYDIEGILHWGYNFYNSQESVHPIDPYRETCAESTFPGGDPFLVYPGAGGKPEESIRMMLMDQAMNDLRALQLLASRIGREKAVAFMEEELEQEITFSVYPKSAAWLLMFRNKVNRLLQELIV